MAERTLRPYKEGAALVVENDTIVGVIGHIENNDRRKELYWIVMSGPDGQHIRFEKSFDVPLSEHDLIEWIKLVAVPPSEAA